MIAEHFRRCSARGEAISVLTASEAIIYGRFGYGRAADHLTLNLPRHAALRPLDVDDVTVRIEALNAELHGPTIDRLHRAAGTVAGLVRPGWATRDRPGVRARFLADPAFDRAGYEPLRIMVAERAGQPIGYALFARHGDVWRSEPFGATVKVQELAAVDPGAAYALWQRLLDLDLTRSVSTWIVPVDDPLLGFLVDVDGAQPRLADLLWVRLIDVPRALAARQYAADLDVVLAVTDAGLPTNAGLWRVQAKAYAAGATVTRTTAPADLALDVRDLGAAYLGGHSLAFLATAGLVHELTPGALAPASSAFGWPIAPACSYIF
jgi:predicted acetyltransferase